jgi:ribosomal protein L33
LFFDKCKISGNFIFESMNLGMFNRFYPSLKAKEQLEERVDLNKFDRNEERYVIPMHRKNFWTNKWMHELRKKFFRLQVHHYDPSA